MQVILELYEGMQKTVFQALIMVVKTLWLPGDTNPVCMNMSVGWRDFVGSDMLIPSYMTFCTSRKTFNMLHDLLEDCGDVHFRCS